MLLIGSEDEFHKELQRYAMQVKFSLDDMAPAPDMPGAFRLPMSFLPESAIELFKYFYDHKRDFMFQWAKEKGLILDKLTKLGPQIILLKRGEISVASNELSFSIVLPNPHETQAGRVAATITSSISENIPAYSRRDLEVGDVLVLEGLEKLLVPFADARGAVQELFLVSAVHTANFVGQGNGGWNETVGIKENS